MTDPNADLVGREIASDRGPLRIVGTWPLDPAYLDVEAADGRLTLRKVEHVRASLGEARPA